MITRDEALAIARAKIADAFDLDRLTPTATCTDGAWEVCFRRTPPSPGGEPRLVIDGETGEVLSYHSTQ